MTKTMTAEARFYVGWNISDRPGLGPVVDNNDLQAKFGFADGAGDGQVNIRWHAERTISAAGSDVLDLQALTDSLYGGLLSYTFQQIKAICVVNLSSDATLRIGAAASNAWLGPFGGAAHTLSLAPLAAFQQVERGSGWPVSSAERYLRLANLGAAPATYRIALIGVDATGGSSSSL